MFFQFSPPVKKPEKKPITKKPEVEPNVLILAPFSKYPKICFENVKIGQAAVETLIIKNPMNHKLEVTAQLNVDDKTNLHIEWSSSSLLERQEVSLKLYWTPTSAGGWRYTLHVTAGNRISSDIPVILKSITSAKKKNAKPKTFPRFVTKKTTSPVNLIKKKSPLKRPALPNITNIPEIRLAPPERLYDGKENAFSRRDTYVFGQNVPTHVEVTFDCKESGFSRRDTYIVGQSVPVPGEVTFDDSLEKAADATFEKKLEMHCSEFTLLTPMSSFRPGHCSSEEKSIGSLCFSGKSFQLFPDEKEGKTLSLQNKGDFGVYPITYSRDVKDLNSSSAFYKQSVRNISPITYARDTKNVNFHPAMNTRNNINLNLPPTEEKRINPVQNSSPLTQSKGIKSVNFPPDTYIRDIQDLNFSSATYTADVEENNISTETYVKDANISSETYTKDVRDINISSETFTKDISSNTFTLDASDHESNDCPTPTSCKKARLDSLLGASVRDTIEAGLWSNTPRALSTIIEAPSLSTIEESSTSRIFPMKHKSDLTFSLPSKRPKLEEPSRLEWAESHTAAIIDPQMGEFLDKQQDNLKRWLNAILAPPKGLESNDAGHTIDVAKLWRECQKKQENVGVVAVDTSSSNLKHVRKNALILYKSTEVQVVLEKVWKLVEDNRLMIRSDRDIHLDLSLQSDIVRVLLSYNPLWLRVGLETVYGRMIPLKSNSDLVGLTTFIWEKLIKDPFLLRKHKSVHTNNYKVAIKKAILRRILALIYFLDVAKKNKLISHDPCLFCKNAHIKESREALLSFSRETVASMGDITKFLKHFGYILSHKQTYLDEFDYTVNFIGTDLRDGVRLTRVMEKIFLHDNLSKNLRVPAISRLQKVHNVKITFDVLQKNDFELQYDIVPKDIVNGHKEKTLCFLWQIIYKLQTPLMTRSVTIITQWWRSEAVLRKREELRQIRLRREEAALKIQLWYRRKTGWHMKKREAAAIKIQSWVRRLLVRRRFEKLKWAITVVETRYVAKKLMMEVRMKFETLKYAALIIQRTFRAYRQMKLQREYYLMLRYSVIIIQRKFRAKVLMKTHREYFLRLKHNVVFIQRTLRANRLMRIERDYFLQLKSSVIIIQRRFRATELMKTEREYFLQLKQSVIFIQRKFRASRMMRVTREYFLQLKQSAIFMQRRFRANQTMRIESENYQQLKYAVIVVQKRYRANQLMKIQHTHYLELRRSVIIVQRRFRANQLMTKGREYFLELRESVIVIQRRFRANQLMKSEREYFLKLKQYAIFIQRRFRAHQLMKIQRENFLRLKHSATVVQQRFRAKQLMRSEREHFLRVKQFVTIVQTRFRADQLMKIQRQYFLQLKHNVIIVQRRFRATHLMRTEREYFLRFKQSVILVQRRFRANQLMKVKREYFLQLKHSVILIQNKLRAIQIMKIHRECYLQYRRSVILVQRRFRANQIMKSEKARFLALKQSVILMQRKFHANKQMKIERTYFLQFKRSVVIVQRRFRAILLMREHREYFLQLQQSIILVQRRFRANQLMKEKREYFLQLKQNVILIQNKVRAIQLMKTQRAYYLQYRRNVILVQRRFRANRIMKSEKEYFLALKRSVVLIQRRFRANQQMKVERTYFLEFKQSVITIQRRFRTIQLMKEHREYFLQLRQSAILIQRRFRANKLMQKHRQEYLQLKTSALLIQKRFRDYQLMKTEQEHYLKLRQSVIVVQKRFRANRLMKSTKEYFFRLRQSVILVQRRFRANQLKKIECNMFKQLRMTVVFVQRRFRAIRLMRIERQYYVQMKRSVVIIQRRFRANQLMKPEREYFLRLRHSAIVIQRRFRALNQMKIEQEYYSKLKQKVVFVQRRYKANRIMEIERKYYEQLRRSTILVQRNLRARLTGRVDYNNFQKLRRAAILIQRRWRVKIALKLEQQRRENAAASRIQAAWKGYKLRKSLEPKLLKIYEQLKNANENAKPENTLGSRCKNSVFQLSKSNLSVNEMIIVLQDIDYITRRCQQTLQNYGPILAKPLYNVIKSTNRSMPETELCTIATNILINFYRYKPCRTNAWAPEYMESLVTVMLHFCDKETPLFPTLCTLLYFFLAIEEYKSVITSTPKFWEKMKQISDKSERKMRMVQKVKSPMQNDSLFQVRKNLPLPSDTPDWGLEYKTKPRVFLNSVQAVNVITSMLNI